MSNTGIEGTVSPQPISTYLITTGPPTPRNPGRAATAPGPGRNGGDVRALADRRGFPPQRQQPGAHRRGIAGCQNNPARQDPQIRPVGTLKLCEGSTPERFIANDVPYRHWRSVFRTTIRQGIRRSECNALHQNGFDNINNRLCLNHASREDGTRVAPLSAPRHDGADTNGSETVQ